MKNKLKKHGVKILTMIICMVTIVTALVIAPSADTTDFQPNDFACIQATYNPYLFPTEYTNVSSEFIKGKMDFTVEYNQTNQGKFSFITSHSSPTSMTYYFNKLRIVFNYVYGSNYSYVNHSVALTFDDDIEYRIGVYSTQGVRSTPYVSYTNDSGYYTSVKLNEGDTVSMSLYYDPSALTYFEARFPSWYGNLLDLASLGYTSFDLISQPTYSEGYADGLANAPSDGGYDDGYTNGYDQGSIDGYQQGYTDGEKEGYIKGTDFGLEEGYGNGYDQGTIDGYQQGYTEGERIGYNDGYELGYSDGNGDGYSLGYDEGEAYGWANGFGAGQNDMAETSDTFKEMVFAIFDAPSRLIDSMLNFDIFGINLAGLVKTIITLAVVAVILVILLKWLL